MDYIGAGGTLLSKDCISFQTTAKGGNHMKSQRIRIGSRASRLAVIQSEWVMQQIHQIAPEIQLELVTMQTTGDNFSLARCSIKAAAASKSS